DRGEGEECEARRGTHPLFSPRGPAPASGNSPEFSGVTARAMLRALMPTAPRASLLAVLAAASLLVRAAPAAAQDPPPPLPPSDAPLPPSDAPPPRPDRAPPPVAVAPPVAEPPPVVEPPPVPEPPPARDDARVLKGQALLTPVLLDSAFVSTHVG